MAVSAGEVYYNPPCRQKIVVRTAAADTGGARSVLDLYVAPGGFAADYHLHPASEERFTLVRGRLRVSMADRDVILDETGQTVAVPPGTSHRFYSASDDEETLAIVEFTNRAARFEVLLLRELFGLAEEGQSDDQGKPNLMQTSLTLREFSDVLRFTGRPWPLQRALYGAVAPLARLRGYHACSPVAGWKPAQRTELEELPPEVERQVIERQLAGLQPRP
ncbi:cupin domain-containing protein [Streptomyces sp. H39-S7]|uniref:cupin domain-containing protein n=1 Tax=Streptomyces sp. H39-S7 TaxID=3004357 RepID=UPI0022AEDF2C|nr:cupin domain-containing protein [Streptomyces sp. H39-S7]MCZ4124637.1 cupin domain-containing protein [Streptomyces sp. H39-S7]